MRKLFMIVPVLLAVLSSCGGGTAGKGENPLVLVSIVPQKYFVERIAGDLVDVHVLIPPGASPAAWELSPSDMRLVSDAELWLSMGVPAEGNWTAEFMELNPGLSVISSLEGIQRLPIGRYGVPGDGDHGDHHHHGGQEDPHVWLSPELVRSQATVTAEALIELDPNNGETYMVNLEGFLQEITELQSSIHEILGEEGGTTFMVFHPAWGYFADEFDLIQVPIEIGGSEPSPGELAAIIDLAVDENISVVFVSPQFSSSSAEAIAAETGAQTAVLDPLAENWPENMLTVARALQGSVD